MQNTSQLLYRDILKKLFGFTSIKMKKDEKDIIIFINCPYHFHYYRLYFHFHYPNNIQKVEMLILQHYLLTVLDM